GSTSVHNYYTFGMEWINLADTLQPRNLYRYNGKEMIEEMDLKLLAYGARYYDPSVGRCRYSQNLCHTQHDQLEVL
ncbi:MAG: hypothetical protein WAT22_10790, partial [Saprospiraceae bacterium]